MQGFILAGGKSSRMGEPKANLMLGGSSFIHRAFEALATIADEGIYVAGGPSGGSRDLPVLADSEFVEDGKKRGGAILGLHTALAKAHSDWVAVLACDLPFVTGEFLNRLSEHDRAGFDAVVPVQHDGIPQPLCALYRRQSCLPVVEEMIWKCDLKMQKLVSLLSTRFIEFDEVADLNGSANFFLNVNKPEDYESALKIAAS